MKNPLLDQKPMPKSKLSNAENAALNALVANLNDPRITGAQVPPGVETRVPLVNPGGATVMADPMPEAPSQEPISTPASAPATPPERDYSRIFFTGRTLSGKDFVAKHAGCQIYGFAEPLYALQELFFPGSKKDDARSFLQRAGQYGRGTVGPEYPLTPERAAFVETIRRLAKEGVLPDYVDWASYGSNENIWLEAALKRVSEAPPGRVAITNCRFTNELRRLISDGWVHMHVMASPTTWAERVRAVGSKPEDPKFSDISEKLAQHFDGLAIKEISQRRDGAKLNVIFNDDKRASPSPRFWNLSEWVTHIGGVIVEEPVPDDFPTSL